MCLSLPLAEPDASSHRRSFEYSFKGSLCALLLMRSWLLLDLLELHSPCPCSFSTTPLELLHNSRPNVCGITRDVENNPTSLHQQDTGPAQRGLAILSLFVIVYNEWQKSLLYPSSTPNLLELFDANTSWRKNWGLEDYLFLSLPIQAFSSGLQFSFVSGS